MQYDTIIFSIFQHMDPIKTTYYIINYNFESKQAKSSVNSKHNSNRGTTRDQYVGIITKTEDEMKDKTDTKQKKLESKPPYVHFYMQNISLT